MTIKHGTVEIDVREWKREQEIKKELIEGIKLAIAYLEAIRLGMKIDMNTAQQELRKLLLDNIRT